MVLGNFQFRGVVFWFLVRQGQVVLDRRGSCLYFVMLHQSCLDFLLSILSFPFSLPVFERRLDMAKILFTRPYNIDSTTELLASDRRHNM